jgi:hypothetical protein
MMRGWTPLFAVAMTLGVGVGTGRADEPPPGMIEVPTVTPPPPPPAATVVAPTRDDHHGILHVAVDVGGVYRTAFGSDLVGVLAELELGARNERFGVAARFGGEVGATVAGLKYEMPTLGPVFSFRVSLRLRLAVAATFGVFMYQRATTNTAEAAVTAGLNGTVTCDLVRTRRGGGLYLLGRLGWSYIDNLEDDLGAGSSVQLVTALGYRY